MPANYRHSELRPGNIQHPASRGIATYARTVAVDHASLAVVILVTLVIFLTPISHFEERVLPAWSAIQHERGSSMSELYIPSGYEYPWQKEPLPSWACALVVITVPWLVIGFFQIKLRSLWDFHAGATGIAKAVIATTFVTTILKHFIGGFRPYYMEVCNPDLSLIHESHWFNVTVCNGDPRQIAKALQGFPSGHTSNSFAAAIFLALYMNGKLKAFSDHASDFWVFIVVIAPLIGASLVSGCMYTSHQHHAHEIIFGMIIGIGLGTLAYRSSYASIFDFRYNHIPLPPISLRTRFYYTLKAPHLMTATLQDGGNAEHDNLVVWSWWSQSSLAFEQQEKEIAWLRGLRSLKTTGQVLNPILGRYQKRAKRNASEAIGSCQEDSVDSLLKVGVEEPA